MSITLIIAVLTWACSAVHAAPALDNRLFTRDNTCSGIASLSQCGGSFPSDFCCPTGSLCVPLNVTGAIATICCPPGQDCRTIQPTSCDLSSYNATIAASNSVHASPINAPATCGTACCPPGYSCRDGQVCIAKAAPASSGPASTSTQAATTAAATSASASAVYVVGDSSSTTQAATSSSFSGASFAAGFVPGIVLGMLLFAGFIWFMKRRKTRASEYNHEKARSQDRLTGLSPIDGQQQFPSHMRSISEPAMVGGEGYRTDFLRSSPIDALHTTTAGEAASFGTIEEESSSASDQYEPKPMFQFSPSIRQPRSPLPAHLKRGTLSYTISPIRQLRTKKSTRSLRRHAASPMRSDSQHTRSSVSRSNTSASTETIQVLMTPDQRPSYVAPPLPYSAYSQRVHDTPTRQPNQSQPGLLGSPYSYQPRENALNVDTSMSARRVTTFSSLMEKAGLRREDLYSDSSH